MNTARKLIILNFNFFLPVGLLDAAVDHFNEYVWVFVELYHELLPVLHLPEGVFIDYVGVVEEQVVF